jgi:hypothetical protein
MPNKKEENKLNIDIFAGMNTLMKLRVFVTLIFLLSSLAIILIFSGEYFIAALLFLVSYLMVFILMVKLFLVKGL